MSTDLRGRTNLAELPRRCSSAVRAVPLRLLVVFAAPVLLLIPIVGTPLEHDEAVYSVVGRAILHGGVPYHDVWDHKPPLIGLWYSLSFALFGYGAAAPRLLALLVVVGSTAMFLFIARIVFPRSRADSVAVLFAFTPALLALHAVANAEVFTVLPALGALYAVLRGQVEDRPARAWLWYLAAGICSGLAVATKQVVIVPTAFLGLSVLLGSANGLRNTGAYVAGGAVVLGAIALPYLMMGYVADLIYANVTYNRYYLAGDGPSQFWGVVRFLILAGPLVIGAALGLISFLESRPGTRLDWIVIGWCGASIAAVFMTGRMYDHYWVTTLPAFALMCGFVHLGRMPKLFGSSAARLGLVALLAVTTGVSAYLNLKPYLESDATSRHVAQFGRAGERNVERIAVQSRIASLMQPSDTLYEIGIDSGLYLAAEAAPPVRYFYDRPFYLDARTVNETLSKLSADPPTWLLLTRETASPPVTRGQVEFAVINDRIVPQGLAGFVLDNYEFVERFEFADIYRLRPSRDSSTLRRGGDPTPG